MSRCLQFATHSAFQFAAQSFLFESSQSILIPLATTFSSTSNLNSYPDCGLKRVGDGGKGSGGE